MKNALFAGLYFTIQRARGGVTGTMIDRAKSLLDAPERVWRDHVLQRLRHVHGASISWQSLAKMATMDRHELRDRANDIIQRGKSEERFDVRKTSGSTGTPFQFPKDRSMTAWMDAAMWAVYAWHGVRPGLPHARFWGTPLDSMQRRVKAFTDHLMHRRRIGAFELSPESVHDQFRTLLDLEPVYAYGYPTLMATFADLCLSAGLDGRELEFKVVISTGEILSETTREQLTEFFGCPVMNEYGCTESGIVAFECEKGTMHSVPVAVWPEVVGEDGLPIDHGGEGEIVVSDLYGSTMPLLRYQLHDRGVYRSFDCTCGRHLPELKVTSGRTDSFIQTPRGKVYDAILAYSVPPEVQRFRVEQTRPNHLEARIVPGTGFDETSTPMRCKERWEELLGPGMSVAVHTVERIPVEESGKLRYFVPLEEEGSSSDPDTAG